MKIVGFQSGHDVSYCILEDGVPILHEELERFTREKEPHGCGLKFFFDRNPDMTDIDGFAFGNRLQAGTDPFNTIDKDSFNKAMIICKDNFIELDHHQTHAVNSFYTSKFEEAIIFTIDAGGNFSFNVSPEKIKANPEIFEQFKVPENSSFLTTVPETLTVFHGTYTPSGTAMKKVNKLTYVDRQPPNKVAIDRLNCVLGKKGVDWDVLNLGLLWNQITQEVFGLSVGYPKGNQAGTVMAMATMGTPKYAAMFSDPDITVPVDISRHPVFDTLKKIAQRSEQDGFDVAASLQKFTEDTFFKVIELHLEDYKHIENICFSGGVSLNCVMLAKIKKRFPWVKNVFCDPVPYDGGLSIGAARTMYHFVFGNPRVIDDNRNLSPYLGTSYSRKDIDSALQKNANKLTITTRDKKEVAQLLSQEKIIAVFGGGAESGRRALGNRSILADPRSKTMKDTINQKVKHRQWYRPFAPSILLEHTEEWFEDFYYSPYMSFAPKFKEEKRDLVPAVVHFDGTGRLQTVDKDISPWYHSFIEEWYKISGVPVVLNTSFNDREPIVETPDHAIECFLRTNIDYLYFYDHELLVEKTK
jgi:predicted NodU family carbamoyl transferase